MPSSENCHEIGFSDENYVVCIPFNRKQKILLDPVKLEMCSESWHVNSSVHKCKKASSGEKKIDIRILNLKYVKSVPL